MNIQELTSKIDQVASILQISGFAVEAARIQGLLDALISGSMDKHACLSEIEGLCGVKSFGDLYVIGIDDVSWLRLLSEVRVLAKRL